MIYTYIYITILLTIINQYISHYTKYTNDNKGFHLRLPQPWLPSSGSLPCPGRDLCLASGVTMGHQQGHRNGHRSRQAVEYQNIQDGAPQL